MTEDEARAAHAARMTKFHAEHKTFDGRRTMYSMATLEALCRGFAPRTLLDYGCGKALQWRPGFEALGRTIPDLKAHLGLAEVGLYDVGLPAYADPPGCSFDAVLCNDVLQFVPDADVRRVVDEVLTYADKFAYFHVAVTRPKKDSALADEPWVRDLGWWERLFADAGRANPRAAWFARVELADGTHAKMAGRGRATFTLPGDDQITDEDVARYTAPETADADDSAVRVHEPAAGAGAAEDEGGRPDGVPGDGGEGP